MWPLPRLTLCCDVTIRYNEPPRHPPPPPPPPSTASRRSQPLQRWQLPWTTLCGPVPSGQAQTSRPTAAAARCLFKARDVTNASDHHCCCFRDVTGRLVTAADVLEQHDLIEQRHRDGGSAVDDVTAPDVPAAAQAERVETSAKTPQRQTYARGNR